MAKRGPEEGQVVPALLIKAAERFGNSAPASAVDGDQIIVETPVVNTFSGQAADQEVELKLDLDATSFSENNALFFAVMSELAYKPKDVVRSTLESQRFWGTDVPAGDNFVWFEADDAIASRTAFDAIHDTEAYVAANDDMIMAVFRGTSARRDWLTNLSILPRDCPAAWKLGIPQATLHRGFDDGVNTVWIPGEGHTEGMLSVIERFHNEEGKSRKLYIAGHSLGGALATIAAARLAFEASSIKIAGVYSYGSPRVFDAGVADIFDATANDGVAIKDKFFRSRNNNDIVTRVPPSPYKHVGTEIYFDRFGTISTASFADRALGRLSALLRFSVIDGISDHNCTEYIRHFKQAVADSKLSLLTKTTSVIKDAVQKVVPVNKAEMKKEEENIEAAKQAALEASLAGDQFVPENVPAYLVQAEG